VRTRGENLGKGDHLGYLGKDERVILKWILKNKGDMALIGLMWLRIRKSGGPL
jgi:hypothetical protein